MSSPCKAKPPWVASQIIVHPLRIPSLDVIMNGRPCKMVIYRIGNRFSGVIDCPNGMTFEMAPCWLKKNHQLLLKISAAASRTLRNCGIDVEVYGS